MATISTYTHQKMKMDVEEISREMIKPSSPTPDHLRHYQLSFLDQIQPPVFMPWLMFYPTQHDASNIQRCNSMKQALSKALALYYPLAGRIKGIAFIDCNDEGVLFVQAKASCRLSDILENPNPNNHNKFIPLDLVINDVTELLAMVQVTYLDCGGLAVSLGISHKITDAWSKYMFLNCWATLARGVTDGIISPQFYVSTLFPPKDISGFQPGVGVRKEKLVAKRFVFDASAIKAIRAMYTDTKNIDAKLPTRVEALSTFIWSRFMAASVPAQEKFDQGKIYAVNHAMNLRKRVDHPPRPDQLFGNMSIPASLVPTMNKEDGRYDVLNQMKEGIRKVDAEYVKHLQENDGFLDFLKQRAARFRKGEVITFSFTSLTRIPLYATADFGWGQPVWFGAARLTFRNLCCFYDTKYGDGIEAWINLEEEAMAKLEADKEFMSYVSKPSNISYVSQPSDVKLAYASRL